MKVAFSKQLSRGEPFQGNCGQTLVSLPIPNIVSSHIKILATRHLFTYRVQKYCFYKKLIAFSGVVLCKQPQAFWVCISNQWVNPTVPFTLREIVKFCVSQHTAAKI